MIYIFASENFCIEGCVLEVDIRICSGDEDIYARIADTIEFRVQEFSECLN